MTVPVSPELPDVPGVDVVGALSLLDGDAVLLDVRERNEWDAGHAPHAVHIPLRELSEATAWMSRQRRVVVVCRSGRRSAHATAALRVAGVDALNLLGGMQAWRDAGADIVADHGATPTVI
jgi:rhodanese-related sulfurtransferase